MDRSLPIFGFFLLIAVGAVNGSYSPLPSQLYWNTVLPNTPMPNAIKELLYSGVSDEKGTTVSVGGQGGVNVNTGKGGGTHVSVGGGGVNVNTGKGGGTHVSVGGGSGVHVNTGKGSGTHVSVGGGGGGNGGGTHVSEGGGSGVDVNTGKGSGTHVSVGGGGDGKGGVNVNTGKGGGTHVSVGGGGGVNVNTKPKGKPVVVHVGAHSPFLYQYAATDDQVHDDPNVALFFLEKDIHTGATMNLHFTRTTTTTSFLLRRAADAIPFSSSKLPEILSRFSIEPNSVDATTVAEALQVCEAPAAEGETRTCATSLESMVDFATTNLGTKHVLAVSTTVSKEGTAKQRYTISSTKKLGGGEAKAVACHAQQYVYAVFFCHATSNTRTYVVSMDGEDGTKAEAVVVCHTDTSKWNPKHLAFQVLDVMPGTVPVCHFLPQDHIVWSPNK